ncbi:type IV secretion protein rhs [Haloferula helveola]|uniref:Type IV secretion protein rhs n=1 Tax=Haloferula helveola TaxID=490095 RepID=A0ABN6H4N9_9BACT|nr:type IV secretion protein rhs [Haloferula helveola]
MRPHAFAGLLTLCALVSSPAEEPVPAPEAIPADALTELRYRSVLPMPYFEENGQPQAAELEALQAAISAWKKGEDKEDRLGPLKGFVEAHPAGTFRLWVEASIADELYRSGRYSAALRSWESAWSRSKGMFESKPRQKAYAGRVGVELGGLYARLGRKHDLGRLLQDLDGFALIGPDTEKRQRIREAYTQMGLHPERSFNCGPFALANALESTDVERKVVAEIRNTPGDGGGFTLADLKAMLDEHGLKWQVARLGEEGKPVFPCVVHWHADHYAAALKSRGSKVLVVDPTFEVRKWIPMDEFLAESSGSFLIPGEQPPSGWEALSQSEMASVNGRGAPEAKDDDDDGCEKSCGGGSGMPYYGYDEFSLGIMIRDTPLVMETPFGPGMQFTLTYKENSKVRDDPNMPFSNVGTKWSFNFHSFIRQDDVDTSKYRLYLPGGRQETHVHNGTDFDLNRMSHAQLTTITGGYKRTSNDGFEMLFTKLSDDTERHYLTELRDPQGNSLTLSYIAGPSSVGDLLDEVADGFGRKLVFKYEEAGEPWLVSRVVEKVGATECREVSLDYADGELAGITDAEGIYSSFGYADATDLSAVSSMTTPYGTTRFDKTSFTRPFGSPANDLYFSTLTITDPVGLQEKLLYAPFVDDDAFPEVDESAFDQLDNTNNPFWPESNVWVRDAYLNEAVTFHWDKKANKYHPPNFQTGKNFEFSSFTVWMLGYVPSLGIYKTMPYVDATKTPLTEWQLADYPDDTPAEDLPTDPVDFLPIAEGMMVRNESGALTPAISRFEYTSTGLVKVATDPLGRRLEYIYAGNGIDVEEVWVGEPTGGNPGEYQTSGMVYGGSVSYLPTEIYDAANNKTTIVYNSKGQVTQVTNALNEILDFTYGWPTGFTDPTPGSTAADNDGFLQSIKLTDSANSLSAVTVLSLTYHDNTGYVHTATDSLTGLVTTFNTYDDLGRVTKVTHPDQSTEEYFYELDGVKYLDPVRHLNREGMNTHYAYNGNRQLISIIDPEMRNTRIKWCSCGHMEAITDALGRHTEWKRDLLGRVTRKILPDGKEISYTYEGESGRLDTVTYPEEQGGANASVDFDWHLDGQLAEKSHPGDTDPFFAQFTYDDLLGRMQTAKWYDEDGVQQTTSYGYHSLVSALGSGQTGNLGAGLLHTVDGPWADDTVVHSYDALNRRIGTQIADDGSPWANPTFSWAISTIDGLGRITQHVNDMGTFTTAYTGTDTRPDSVTRGSFQTLYNYLPSNQGGFLSQIHNKHGSTTISKFDYTYTPDGKIATWTKEQGGTVKFMEFVHDLAGQLTKATIRQTNASGAILETLGYGYDRAGNRTAKTVDGEPFTANFNSRNQLTTGDFLGEVPFVGEMDEWAEVEVTAGGETKEARVREFGSSWIFETKVPLESDGTTQVDVQATDVTSNVTSKSYRIDSGSGQWASLTYDDNGNTVSRTVDGVTTTYTWDRENRLETVSVGGVTERFVYNATGERVKIIRDPGGAGEVERRFVWIGGIRPAQERSGSNVIVSKFHAEGELRRNSSTFDDYLYCRDHLGSVREFVASSGSVVACRDYSPYGILDQIGSPTLEPSLGYAGYFNHELSSNYLTAYRAYDPSLGRWVSSDPWESIVGTAAERLPEGPNLYGYVGNSVLSSLDPLGLREYGLGINGVAAAVGGGCGELGIYISGDSSKPLLDRIGLYGGVGAVVGFDIGVGLTASAYADGDLAGRTTNVGAGLGPFGVGLGQPSDGGDLFDEAGKAISEVVNGTGENKGGACASVNLGAPVAATASRTHTGVLTPGDVVRAIGGFIKSIIP